MSLCGSILTVTLGLMMLGWPALANAGEWKILTHNAEDQTIVDPESGLRGVESAGMRAFYVEFVKTLLEELDQPARIESVPLKRGLIMLQSGQAQALFNLVRTPEREDQFKWVGPLEQGISFFHESSQRPTGITSLEDARRVKGICVLNGGVHESELVRLGFSNLVDANSYTRCFAMLIYGRVDLTPATRVRSRALQAEGIAPAEIETIVPTPVILLESQGFIAFSRSTPDQTIQEWQATLERLKAHGVYDSLRARYAGEDE